MSVSTSYRPAVTSDAAFAGAGADDDGPDKVWSNPGNITADDASNAKCILGAGTQSNFLEATVFGFAIPDSAKVLGIEVTVERSRTGLGNDTKDKSARILVAGVAAGDDNPQALGWVSSVTIVTYGGAADAWGLTLSGADINATTFGFALQIEQPGGLGGDTGHVDYVTIAVTYQVHGRVVRVARTARTYR